jgi:hypothetical protein
MRSSLEILEYRAAEAGRSQPQSPVQDDRIKSMRRPTWRWGRTDFSSGKSFAICGRCGSFAAFAVEWLPNMPDI